MALIKGNRPCCVLSIAGSDSGGGAGIQADLKSISANGCYGLSVITAITAQNSYAVTDIHKTPLETITSQLKAVFEDMPIDAIKIGMLGDKDMVQTVASFLKAQPKLPPIILDPVMVSKAGAPLLEMDAITSLKEQLLPLATLVTPNLPEAQILADLEDEEDAEILAKNIGKSLNILIKGGHQKGEKSIDYLYLADGHIHSFEQKRINSKNTHGTGCSLSSAIAAQMALGKDIRTAVKEAKQYISHAIQTSQHWQMGKGHGPISHFEYL
ncbi:MAG: bifunctional hydroxymethylpyrimidine kinase/phosphomethylpyrimidine kinase [Alphaproteobacteria bacterium]